MIYRQKPNCFLSKIYYRNYDLKLLWTKLMPIRPIKADMSAKKCKNQRFPNIVVLYIDGKDILCLLRITMEAIVQKHVTRSYNE